MISGRDIIVVGLQPWDIEIGSNCKNIALEFAKDNRVLYVNPPMDTITRIRDRKTPAVQKRLTYKRTGRTLQQVAPNIWNLYPPNLIQSINWLPSRKLFDFFNRINNRTFAKDILKAAEELSFRNYLLFNDSDMFRSFYLAENLKPDLSIYYSRDNLLSQPYFHKHGHIMEPALMKKSSFVTANSEYLASEARKANPESFYIGQGCDLSLFDPLRSYEIPSDIREIQRPVIGYIGMLSGQRLDIELLKQLAGKRPDWSLVLVGKPDSAFEQSGLDRYSNVHFLGLKDASVLAQYLAQFDVAINPQLINEMTIGNYPRKIDEYLAMGKPVVATATETMKSFAEVTYLGKTVDDYIMLIEKALGENSPVLASDRIAFAGLHTWENCVKEIYRIIDAVYRKRN